MGRRRGALERVIIQQIHVKYSLAKIFASQGMKNNDIHINLQCGLKFFIIPNKISEIMILIKSTMY